MTAVMPDIEPGRYSCPVCPRRFEMLADKKDHIRAEHQKAAVS